jgi:hypothetical protein
MNFRIRYPSLETLCENVDQEKIDELVNSIIDQSIVTDDEIASILDAATSDDVAKARPMDAVANETDILLETVMLEPVPNVHSNDDLLNAVSSLVKTNNLKDLLSEDEDNGDATSDSDDEDNSQRMNIRLSTGKVLV